MAFLQLVRPRSAAPSWLRPILCLGSAIIWLLVACLHCSSSLIRAEPASPVERVEVDIPFRYDPPFTPYIVVDVMVNGRGPLPFVVDTGVSTPLLIDTLAARKLQLRPARLHGLVNGSIELASAGINSVSLIGSKPNERLDFPQPSAYVVDLKMLDGTYTGPRIAGIIGAPLLAQYPVRLDFIHKTMAVVTTGAPGAPSVGAAVVTLMSRKGGYHVMVSPQKRVSVRLLVDTGAVTSSLPLSLTPFLKPIGSIQGRHRQLGSVMIGDRLRLATLEIGGLPVQNVAMDLAPSFAFAELGLDFLSRFAMTLDFPRGKLILEPMPGTESRSGLRGWTGIELGRRGRGYRIQAVAGGSPAWNAGAVCGDEVLEVDRHSLRTLPFGVAEALLNGGGGQPASLTIRRGGQTRTVQFVRGNEFEGPRGPLAGATLEKSDGGRPVVLQIAEGSLCERAGLVAQDEVLMLNGIPAESLSADETWQQVHGPTVTLQVARRGQPHPIVVTLNDPWYVTGR